MDRLAGELEAAGLEGYLIQVLALKTVLLFKKDRFDEAQAIFEKALIKGEKEGYIRTFIDRGEPAALLLRRVNEPALGAYRARLLQAFTHVDLSPESVQVMANASLAFPLTSREMEILLHIAEGDDNQALADEYTISINTVKKHISHLFEKLDVKNRLQAVEKARRLGLLS